MKLTFLGTGNAFAPKRDWSCILVNDTILLDASPIALANLKQVDADATAIRHIFITHFHGDHFFGLPSLLLEYKFLSPTDAPLTIIGPRGVEAKVRAVMELAYPGTLGDAWPRPITFVEAQAGAGQSADGLTFDAEAMEHGEPDFPALGYRLHLPDGILAYSGDTRMTEALYDLLAGVQVAILEADSGPGERVHLGVESITALAASLPDTAVAIVNHLDVPDDGPWADLPVLIPHDLETFVLTLAPHVPPEVQRD